MLFGFSIESSAGLDVDKSFSPVGGPAGRLRGLQPPVSDSPYAACLLEHTHQSASERCFCSAQYAIYTVKTRQAEI